MEERDFDFSILWRSIVQRGHEYCQLRSGRSGHEIEGRAVFLNELEPCALSYRITCDELWQTQSASIEGWVGKERITIEIRTDAGQHWWMNDIQVAEVSGCIDLDLNFSPSTNMLPIRRSGIKVGEKVEVIAAWLKFPSFRLEPLSQVYTKLADNLYRYSSGNGSFVANLRTNDLGFVLEYPGIWVAE